MSFQNWESRCWQICKTYGNISPNIQILRMSCYLNILAYSGGQGRPPPACWRIWQLLVRRASLKHKLQSQVSITMQALKDASQRGCDTILLVDYIGAFNLRSEYIQELPHFVQGPPGPTGALQGFIGNIWLFPVCSFPGPFSRVRRL